MGKSGNIFKGDTLYAPKHILKLIEAGAAYQCQHGTKGCREVPGDNACGALDFFGILHAIYLFRCRRYYARL
jgi:hypothetical protein